MNYYLDDYEMKCDQNEGNLDSSQKKESLYNVKPLTMSSLLPSVRTPENMILVKNEEFPQEITISPFMLTSHFPNNYEKLLYSILQKYAHKNVWVVLCCFVCLISLDASRIQVFFVLLNACNLFWFFLFIQMFGFLIWISRIRRVQWRTRDPIDLHAFVVEENWWILVNQKVN